MKKTVKTIDAVDVGFGLQHTLNEENITGEVEKLVEEGWTIEAVIPVSAYIEDNAHLEEWVYRIVVSKEE